MWPQSKSCRLLKNTPVQGLQRFACSKTALKDGKCPSHKEIPATPINGAVCNLVVKDEDREEDEMVIFTNQVKELIGGDIPDDEETFENCILKSINKTISYLKSHRKK